MGILIAWPWLALVPIILFSWFFARVKKGAILVVAILWLGYLPYEYGMKLRLLCSGECDIRVDLLLIYPILILGSVIGLAVFASALRGKRTLPKAAG
jgi:hypothetical protein